MCVIIHKPRNHTVATDTLTKAWQSNPHGSGVMYVNNNELIVVKGLMTLDALTEQLNNLNDKEVVIHFRLASSGKINPEQTHPFWIKNKKIAFVHNGVIGKLSHSNKYSDTVLFNDRILAGLPDDFLDNPSITRLLDSYVENSIMMFMDNRNMIRVIGDCTGSAFIDGCWFSNLYWQNEEEYDPESTEYDEYDENDLDNLNGLNLLH